MNTYEKLTLEKFKTNLKGGKYETLTGARRAIGKADWSNVDRETARALADKHFGAPAASAPKSRPAPKKAEKASTPPPKAAVKPGPKVGRPAASASVAAAEKRSGDEPKAAVLRSDHRRRFTTLESLELSKEIIAAGSAAIEAMVRAKQADGNVDVSEAQNAVNVVAAAVDKMGALIGVTNPGSAASAGRPVSAKVDEEEEVPPPADEEEETSDEDDEDKDPLFNDE